MPTDATLLSRMTVNDIELSYITQGDGEPIIFVHGSSVDCRVWDDHREIIAPEYRMFAMSQRYFGTDPWPDGGENFHMQAHADDLHSFITSLSLGPATLVGWSYGAGVCLAMAARNRNLAKRMYLFEPVLTSCVTEPANAKIVLDDRASMCAVAMALVDEGDLPGAVRAFMGGVNGETGAFDGLPTRVRDMMIDNARTLPLLFRGPPAPKMTNADLAGLSIPITISMGEESRDFFQIAARAVADLMPTAELEIVENARHLWPIQDPPGFSRRVLDFLDRGSWH